jgi:cephalosporin hydroxylase
VRPDWVIETGTDTGGRAYFLATIGDLLGHGQAPSIAERRRDDVSEHPRLPYLRAAPHVPETREQVSIVGLDPHAPVILGSRSRRDCTRREFGSFAPLVPVGCRVIVEHGPQSPRGRRQLGTGPHEALRRLMNLNGQFLADTAREGHALMFNQGGFLRRIA